MKNLILLITGILMATCLLKAQSTTSDVYVINPSNGDQNLVQIEKRYSRNPDAFYLSGNEKNPVESITRYLAEKPCVNLHLYVPATSESLTFSQFSLTTDNVNDYTGFFSQWHEKISGKIVIHCLELAEKGITPDVITRLSSITGVPVEIVRYY